MIVTNRHREVDARTTQSIRYYYNPGTPASCKPYELTYAYDLTSLRYKSIDDLVPVGKFTPGEYKATDVILKRVEEIRSPILAYVYGDTLPCAKWIVDGFASESLYNVATSYLSSTESVLLPPGIRESLLTQALAKAKSDNVGISETLAEAGQVLSMLKSPLKSMASLLRNVLYKRSNRRFRRSAQDAASAWLEYRYGWQPLVLTAQEVMNGLPKLIQDRLYSQGATQSSKTVTSYSQDPVYRIRQRPKLYSWLKGEMWNETVRRVRVHYTIADAALANAVALGGSMFNAPALAWELVPLSFVVDWFVGVGDKIKALTPSPYLNFCGYTYSAKWEVKYVTHTLGITMSSDMTKQFCPLAASRSLVKNIYMRDALPFENPPVLPQIDLDYRSWKHVVDSLGLIIVRSL